MTSSRKKGILVRESCLHSFNLLYFRSKKEESMKEEIKKIEEEMEEKWKAVLAQQVTPHLIVQHSSMY